MKTVARPHTILTAFPMLTPPAALVETMGMITGKAPEENFQGLAIIKTKTAPCRPKLRGCFRIKEAE